MGVNNLAEYVAYHQNKLRAQSRGMSTPSAPFTPKKSFGGVNILSSKQSFQTSVVEAPSDQVTVIDFFATWCGPCKVIAPKVVTMSNEEEFKGVQFYKIDVDEVPEVSQELGIRAMPTFLVFKGGEKVDEIVGANERALRASVAKALSG